MKRKAQRKDAKNAKGAKERKPEKELRVRKVNANTGSFKHEIR